MIRPQNGVTRWAMRLGGSAVFLAILLALLPRGSLLSALHAISPRQFALLLIAYLVVHVGAATKWWIVLGRRIPLPVAIRTHFAGLAANLFLPGATGGDAVRAMLAHGSMKDGARVTAAAMADRLIDVVSLGTLTLIGIAMPGHHANTREVLLAVGLLVPAIAIGVATLPRTLPLPWKLFPKLPGRALGERLAIAFGELGRRRFMLLFAFAASLCIQFLLMALSYVPARAMVGYPDFAAWTYAWPLSKIVAFLPISINGLGVREGALAALLTPTGAAPATIVASGLIWQAVMFCGSGVGALIYALTSGPRPILAEGPAE
ncbi:MAG: lysylphosphatidylglycerol synthase transmembrane domain-containing protein [Novosphingobium sp.]